MPSTLVCKSCGEIDSIVWKYDAWAVFTITGLHPTGDLMKSDNFETQIFDYNEIECFDCGQKYKPSEIADMIRKPTS